MADAEATTNTVEEPLAEYLGFECASCRRLFPIIGPLDPIKIALDQPMRVGAPGPLKGVCPHCQHAAEYPVGVLKRFRQA